ncbi:Fe-S cluster assembly protein SufD, partial [Demequina sp. SO4-18]
MTVTDHTRATSDAAHSHGLAAPTPDASRADRPTSFDVDAFAMPTGREEDWRFSAVRDLAPVLKDVEAGGALNWDVPDLPDGVTLTDLDVARGVGS